MPKMVVSRCQKVMKQEMDRFRTPEKPRTQPHDYSAEKKPRAQIRVSGSHFQFPFWAWKVFSFDIYYFSTLTLPNIYFPDVSQKDFRERRIKLIKHCHYFNCFHSIWKRYPHAHIFNTHIVIEFIKEFGAFCLAKIGGNPFCYFGALHFYTLYTNGCSKSTHSVRQNGWGEPFSRQ